jgi:hypothetical protein
VSRALQAFHLRADLVDEVGHPVHGGRQTLLNQLIQGNLSTDAID